MPPTIPRPEPELEDRHHWNCKHYKLCPILWMDRKVRAWWCEMRQKTIKNVNGKCKNWEW